MAEIKLFEDLFDISGRVALVTGGSKGLGRVMAATLAQAGADVALCSRNGEEADVAARRIAERTGSKTLGVKADVSKKDDVTRMVEHAEKELGAIDILVNNAGINIREDVTRLPEEDWDAVININLKGSFLVAQAVLAGMRQRKWGRIVMLGSILSYISLPGRGPYASSKAAILGLTRTLALESAGDDVCVNAICPGPFLTPMNQSLADDPEKNAALVGKIPMGRWGDPNELRGLVLLLCSPACSFMTGSGHLIDGGWTAR